MHVNEIVAKSENVRHEIFYTKGILSVKYLHYFVFSLNWTPNNFSTSRATIIG